MWRAVLRRWEGPSNYWFDLSEQREMASWGVSAVDCLVICLLVQITSCGCCSKHDIQAACHGSPDNLVASPQEGGSGCDACWYWLCWNIHQVETKPRLHTMLKVRTSRIAFSEMLPIPHWGPGYSLETKGTWFPCWAHGCISAISFFRKRGEGFWCTDVGVEKRDLDLFSPFSGILLRMFWDKPNLCNCTWTEMMHRGLNHLGEMRVYLF